MMSFYSPVVTTYIGASLLLRPRSAQHSHYLFAPFCAEVFVVINGTREGRVAAVVL